jgi:hypothetical protein
MTDLQIRELEQQEEQLVDALLRNWNARAQLTEEPWQWEIAQGFVRFRDRLGAYARAWSQSLNFHRKTKGAKH